MKITNPGLLLLFYLINYREYDIILMIWCDYICWYECSDNIKFNAYNKNNYTCRCKMSWTTYLKSQPTSSLTEHSQLEGRCTFSSIFYSREFHTYVSVCQPTCQSFSSKWALFLNLWVESWIRLTPLARPFVGRFESTFYERKVENCTF